VLPTPARFAPSVSASAPVRVMIVDDAVVVRGLLSRWLTEAGGIEIASTHRTGAEAVGAIEHIKPDVVLLDIEMPDMDGITALPLLLKKWPRATVIVASTLTTRNADITLRCLSLGAIDYVAKPSTNRDVTFSTDFRREIIDKVKSLGRRPQAFARTPAPAPASTPTVARPAGVTTSLARSPQPTVDLTLRTYRPIQARAVVIGASTGGPNAVTELLSGLRPVFKKVPVIVAQHMPAMFTAMFADHLRRQLSLDVAEAQSGEMLEAGRVYVAPGGHHLKVERAAAGARLILDNGPPINFCKPSVDFTMSSAAETFGNGVVGVMLTGMGQDGLRGAQDIVDRGGVMFTQDEASSVVWGMPGVVAKKGIASAIDRVPQLAGFVTRVVEGGHHER
jgi:two-component system, chemotaxis family, protein-glutamate methylesterase/glutaminase